MKRREFLKLAGASAAALALPSVVEAADKKDGPVTIWGPPVMPTILLGIAARHGELRKTWPFKVKAWTGPDQLRAGLGSGDIQISIVPSYFGANLRNQGQDVYLLNIMTFGLTYFAGKRPAKGLEDLLGKKVVMPFKNDMPDIVMHILFKHAGLDISKVDITYTSTPQEALMFFLTKKEYEFAHLPEPMVTMATLKGKQLGVEVVRAISTQELWQEVLKTKHPYPQAGLLCTGKFFDENKERVELLQKDLLAAVEFAKNNPASAAEIGSSYLPAPKPALEMAIPYSYLAATPAYDVQDDIELFFKELHEFNPKIVGGKIPDRNLYKKV